MRLTINGYKVNIELHESLSNPVISKRSTIEKIMNTQFIKKGILYIKLRDGSLPNRGHGKKSANSGHMSNGSKGLIIITTLHLLKTVRNRTLTLIEREDDTRSWGNFLVYFSHNAMPT
jgi:outer membrane usher protein FimD/PapC